MSFSQGVKLKLFKVKSEGPASHRTSATSKDSFPRKQTRAFFHPAAVFDMYSATGAQMVSSSVQNALTLSSSSVSSTKLPVRPEASEKICIKQVFGSDEKTAGEFLCFVCPPPSPPNVDKEFSSGHQMPFFFFFFFNRNCQTLSKGRRDVSLLRPAGGNQESFQSC